MCCPPVPPGPFLQNRFLSSQPPVCAAVLVPSEIQASVPWDPVN